MAAGAVASKILGELGISLSAYTYAIGPVTIDKAHFDKEEIFRNPLYMPDAQAALKAQECLEQA